jgi:hypothetical protein
MYLMPPGKVGGGFGDLTATRTARSNVPLVSTFAAQAGNGHWQWYVEQLGGPIPADGYIGFIRGQLPKVEAMPPDDMPMSRLFAGTGQAYLNTSLTDADNSVQVVFKSSPFGTQSHGYEANNSFLLWAYGKRLLIRTGYRDSYGSKHHTQWMWSTRSVNNITVNGKGQGRRTAKAQGEIIAFKTTPEMDVVIGDAADAYEKPLERFTRAIIFVKPEVVIVYDRLKTTEPSTYEYWLHAIKKIDVKDQHQIQVQNDDVVCDIDFLTPNGLTFEQTDQYDPNPRPRIKLREWHLKAKTAEKKRQTEFVAVYWPHRAKDKIKKSAVLETIPGGYVLRIELTGKKLTALLPADETIKLERAGIKTTSAIKLKLEQQNKPPQILEALEGDLP